MFDQLIESALAKAGSSKVLADEMAISPSEISRFRSGEIGLKIVHLKKLFEISGMTLTTAQEREGLINAALLFADLYKGKK